MLRAIINNTEVNLPDRISFVFENPMLTEDRVPIPASLELELAPTPANLAAFGHPERPTSKLTKKELPAVIYWDAIPIFQGVASYNGFSDNIKVHFKSVEKGRLKLPMCDLPLETVDIAVGTRYNSYFDKSHPEDRTKGWEDTYKEIFLQAALGQKSWVWAPLKTSFGSLPLEQHIGYAGKTVVNTMAWVYVGDSIIGRPPINAPIYPFPRVGVVVDAIFNGTLVSNPFNSNDFKDLVIPVTFHKDFPTILGNKGLRNFVLDNKIRAMYPPVEEPLYFNISSFMPDYPSSDFVKDLLKMFGMVLYPRVGQFEIKTLDEIITANQSDDWSSKLIGDPDISTEEGRTLEIEWTDIDAIEGTSEKVTSISNVFDATGYDEQGIAQVEVTTTGEVYEINRTIEAETQKKLYAIAQKRAWFPNEATASDKEVYSIPITVKPTNCVLEVREYYYDSDTYPTKGYKENFWCVATCGDDRKSRKFTPSIARYIGIKQSPTDGYYPQLTCRAYDAKGNRIAPFSLESYGPDGIKKKFYSSYDAWISRDRKRLNASFNLSPLDISTLDMSRKKHVDGVNYFTEKIEIELTHERILPARVSLIEA